MEKVQQSCSLYKCVDTILYALYAVLFLVIAKLRVPWKYIFCAFIELEVMPNIIIIVVIVSKVDENFARVQAVVITRTMAL